MINEIQKIHKSMAPILIRLCRIYNFDSYIINVPIEKEIAVYDFLDCLHRGEYTEIRKIFKLATEDLNEEESIQLWERFLINRRYELPEVRIFIKQARYIKNLWKRRPNIKPIETIKGESHEQKEAIENDGFEKDIEQISV